LVHSVSNSDPTPASPTRTRRERPPPPEPRACRRRKATGCRLAAPDAGPSGRRCQTRRPFVPCFRR
jgi:hypothetical protein